MYNVALKLLPCTQSIDCTQITGIIVFNPLTNVADFNSVQIFMRC